MSKFFWRACFMKMCLLCFFSRMKLTVCLCSSGREYILTVIINGKTAVLILWFSLNLRATKFFLPLFDFLLLLFPSNLQWISGQSYNFTHWSCKLKLATRYYILGSWFYLAFAFIWLYRIDLWLKELQW